MNYPDSNDLYQGKFTNGDPVLGVAPSIVSADYMNAVYDELIAAIAEGGVDADVSNASQLALSLSKQMRASLLYDVTMGDDANHLILTTPAGKQPVVELNNYDKIRFIATELNTGVVSIILDGLDLVEIGNVKTANQLFPGALVTLTYIDDKFWLTEQINPKTGNATRDIGKLIIDTTGAQDMGELILNGQTLSREEFPILWNKISATTSIIDQSTKDANGYTYSGYYGSGDGSTTFTLPDIRGEFLRMLDDGRGVNGVRSYGSYEIGSHINGDDGDSANRAVHGISLLEQCHFDAPDGTARDFNFTSTDLVHSSSTAATLWGMTRPRNIAYYGKIRV